MKADVWRYLIVWENGGIYADLDVKPEYKFNSSTIHDDDDSFFTIDGSTGKFKIINAMILLYFLVTMLTLLIEISVRLALNSSTYELIVIFILFRNNFAVFFCCFAKASYPLQCSSRSNWSGLDRFKIISTAANRSWRIKSRTYWVFEFNYRGVPSK